MQQLFLSRIPIKRSGIKKCRRRQERKKRNRKKKRFFSLRTLLFPHKWHGIRHEKKILKGKEEPGTITFAKKVWETKLDRSKFRFSVKGIKSRRGKKVIKCTGTTTCKTWKRRIPSIFPRIRHVWQSEVSPPSNILFRQDRKRYFHFFCLGSWDASAGYRGKRKMWKEIEATPHKLNHLIFCLSVLFYFLLPAKFHPFLFSRPPPPHHIPHFAHFFAEIK